MRTHSWSRVAWLTIVAASAVAVTAPSRSAEAQDPPASERRIRVQKESRGEVVRRDSAAMADSVARADSIARIQQAQRDSIARIEQAQRDSIARIEQARTDSIARVEAARADSVARSDSIARMETARADSVARADSMARETARLDSIARADSMLRAAQLPAALARRSLYLGLAGGWSTPSGPYGTPYEPGWNATASLGWQPVASRWGTRVDLSYDSHGGDTFTRNTFPGIIGNAPGGFARSTFDVERGSIWSINLAATLDLWQWGRNRLSSLYLIGGGGLHFFDSPELLITPTAPGGFAARFEGESQTVFGLNGGGGIAFGIGRAALFLESRYFTAFTDNDNSDWLPVVLGLRWF